MSNPTDSLIQKLRELLYRREIEVFRVGMSSEYGIREVWRSRIKTPDGVSGWRKYSNREGVRLTMTFEQMRKLLDDANGFVRKMK